MNPLLFGTLLRTAGKQLLQKETTRLLANVTRRARRLEGVSVVTSDMKKLQEIKDRISESGGLSKMTRNQVLSVYSNVRDLSVSPGLYNRTAKAVQEREMKVARRQELLRKASSPATSRYLSADEVSEAYSVMRKRIVAQARRTESLYGETHATRKLNEFLAEFGSARGKSRNDLVRATNTLSRIGNYQGITPEGARIQRDRGVKYFGEQWLGFSAEEQGAIWDEIHRRTSMGSTTSETEVFSVREMLEQGRQRNAAVHFTRDGNGNVRFVSFGFTQTEAEAEAVRQKAVMDTINGWMEQSKGKPKIKLW